MLEGQHASPAAAPPAAQPAVVQPPVALEPKSPPPPRRKLQRIPDQVRLPLEVATHLECRWRDGKYYPARIIERRKAEEGEGEDDAYEYYVHYRKCEWGSREGGVWADGIPGGCMWLYDADGAAKALPSIETQAAACGCSNSGARGVMRASKLPALFAPSPPLAFSQLPVSSAHLSLFPPSLLPPPPTAVNRRMDEWVSLDNFNLDTVCPPEPPEPGEGGRTRNQKRKVDDDHRWAGPIGCYWGCWQVVMAGWLLAWWPAGCHPVVVASHGCFMCKYVLRGWWMLVGISPSAAPNSLLLPHRPPSCLCYCPPALLQRGGGGGARGV